MKKHTASAFALALALGLALVAGCGAPVEAPVAFARLDCPQSGVAVGASFNVAGHFSGTQTLQSSSLTVIADGTEVIDGDTAALQFDTDTIVTVTYTATTEEGGTADARCRFAVGDPVAARLAAELGDDEEDEGEEDVGPVAGDEGEDEEEEEEAPGFPVDLTGTFAVVGWDAPTISGAALAPADQCSHARSVSLARVVQTGKHIEMTMETCELPMPTVNTGGYELIATTVPPAFLAALPPLSFAFELAHGTSGDRFTAVRAGGPAQVAGGHVADTEDLPVSADDERVYDADLDGTDGVTLHVGDVDRAVVYRRFVDRFDGLIVNGDEIDGGEVGNWQVNSETSMLDPLLSFFRDFVGVTVSGRDSTFKMSRTNATTCAELMAAPGLLPAPARPAFPEGCAHFDARDGAVSTAP